MATSASKKKLRTTVRGHGGFSYVSGRDLGREGGYIGYSGTGARTPWTENGIFIQGLTGRAKDGAPGLSLERRDRLENPGLKSPHEFLANGFVCMTCNMMREGHDRLMEKLNKCTG